MVISGSDMWCDEHQRTVRVFSFEDDIPERTRWCPQGGARCRLAWREIVDTPLPAGVE